MKRIITLFAATLLGFSQMMADPTAQTIPGNLDLSNATYSSGSWNGTNTTDITVNGTATYLLNNTTAQAYKITINAVSKNANAQMRVTIKNGETTVSERTITTFATGGWTDYQDFACITSVLPVVEGLTMEIKFLTNQTNIKSINFAAASSADIQIPTDYTHPFDPVFAEINASGNANAKVTTSGQFDSFKHGNTASINFTNTVEQFYKISFDAATKLTDVKAKFTIKQGETVIDETEEVAITQGATDNNGWSIYNSHSTHTTKKIPTGNYTLVISFLKSSGQATYNAKNISFTALDNVALNESTDYTPEAKFANVALTRSIAANKWSTIVLPFDIASSDITTIFGSGVSVAELSSGDASTLTFSTTLTDSKMKANQPYAIKVTSNFTSATINGVTIVNETPTQSISNWNFVGTYSSTTVPTDSYYFKSNKLYISSSEHTTSIKPFRAYLTYNGTPAPALNFVIDGNVTGIAHISADGQINLEEGAFYNLNGQCVSQPTKGLCIVNGKKVIVK